MPEDSAGVEEHFSSRAERYDHRREEVIPGFESMYSTFVEVTEPGGSSASEKRDLEQVSPKEKTCETLDLGAGTGILSGRLEEAGHDVLMLDVSREMLREALGKGLEAAVVGDMKSLPLRPGRHFDNVTSCLAIHHLEAEEKRELYEEVYSLLKPGGRFVHGDMVRAPDPELQERYMAGWTERMREKGLVERAESFREDAEQYDIYETLDDHLDWLRGTGFEKADCYWKRYNFAVFGGEKPGR